MAKRLMKYNPAFLTEDELVRSFVARKTDLDLIVQVIKENATGANQHVLVIGPRGSGKTTLLLRIAAEVRKDPELSKRWYPLVFAEESYEVGSIGEFWLEALFHLGRQTQDARWNRTYEELKNVRDDKALRDRALAQLMDFADKEGKRILLLVENLNMIFDDQMDADDAWGLRHTLLNEPRVMLLASATSRFEQIENSDKAMFDLFKPHELEPLNEAECRTIWVNVTGSEPKDDRIRPIQILTGGNPRLITIISTFGAKLSFRELMEDLMRLVDDHTEYFKSHLDSLPSNERKVYLALADLWKPSTAREVAAVARLDVNKTSSFLSRLVGRGAVLIASQDKRTKWYQTSERMYNIYHLMRRRGAPSSRVKGLVHFMIDFYGEEELVNITRSIAEEACRLDPELCVDHFVFFEAILQGVRSPEVLKEIIDATPQSFLKSPRACHIIEWWEKYRKEAKELQIALFTQESAATNIGNLEVETMTSDQKDEIRMLIERADAISQQSDKLGEAEGIYKQIVTRYPLHSISWLALAKFMRDYTARYEESEKSYRKAIDIDPQNSKAWRELGNLFWDKMRRYDEAEVALNKAVEVDPSNVWAWMDLGRLCQLLKRYDEAEQAYKKATEVHPDNEWGWVDLGQLHQLLKRYDEAEQAYKKATEFDPGNEHGWVNLGQLYQLLRRSDEAEQAYKKAVEIDPACAWAWACLGKLFHTELKRSDEAEKAYRKAIEIDPDYIWARIQIGRLKEELGEDDEAEKIYTEATSITPGYRFGWEALIKFSLEHYPVSDRAIDVANSGLARNPNRQDFLNSFSWIFYKHGHHTQLLHAEKWAKEALTIEPDSAYIHHTLACILCALNKGQEALAHAQKYLDDTALVEKHLDDAIELFVGLAAAGYAKEAKEMLQKSPVANMLAPLTVGLSLYIGEK
jgi:tetratricopeptide (TPR) repeat protein